MTQRLIRGKWKLVIIFLLKDKKLRFSQIKSSIPKVEYYLTDEGKSFIKVIDSMHSYGLEYMHSKLFTLKNPEF